MRFIFNDANENKVILTFDTKDFKENPRHVLVICKYGKGWLLTKHKKRGLEFPGGKLENNEKPIDAAIREVFEETGGIIDSIKVIGQYEVIGENVQFEKNIYFAIIKDLVNKADFMETDGPEFIQSTLETKALDDRFSFIMKDDVIQKSIAYLKETGLIE